MSTNATAALTTITTESTSHDRPITSKPRGVCKFFSTRRGCKHGEKCKFLHGPNERLSPYDKNKTCRFFANGYCHRKDKCWFKHVQPLPTSIAQTAGTAGVEAGVESLDDAESVDGDEACCICHEKPKVYGLLEDCSHVCCLQCICDWRNIKGKSEEMVQSGILKQCPYCRSRSRFVTPSSVFYPLSDPRRVEVVEKYKKRSAEVPCKHYEKSGKKTCPFGKECMFKHTKADGTPHNFTHGIGTLRSSQQYLFGGGLRGHFTDSEWSDSPETSDNESDDSERNLGALDFMQWLRRHAEGRDDGVPSPEDENAEGRQRENTGARATRRLASVNMSNQTNTLRAAMMGSLANLFRISGHGREARIDIAEPFARADELFEESAPQTTNRPAPQASSGSTSTPVADDAAGGQRGLQDALESPLPLTRSAMITFDTTTDHQREQGAGEASNVPSAALVEAGYSELARILGVDVRIRDRRDDNTSTTNGSSPSPPSSHSLISMPSLLSATSSSSPSSPDTNSSRETVSSPVSSRASSRPFIDVRSEQALFIDIDSDGEEDGEEGGDDDVAEDEGDVDAGDDVRDVEAPELRTDSLEIPEAVINAGVARTSKSQSPSCSAEVILEGDDAAKSSSGSSASSSSSWASVISTSCSSSSDGSSSARNSGSSSAASTSVQDLCSSHQSDAPELTPCDASVPQDAGAINYHATAPNTAVAPESSFKPLSNASRLLRTKSYSAVTAAPANNASITTTPRRTTGAAASSSVQTFVTDGRGRVVGTAEPVSEHEGER